ncbi:MAG TPA: roadblock/LC7 domain-containing protein [Oscillatoriaceae cyanobacterium]
MAGRKPTPKKDFLSVLLGSFGVPQGKKKKGRRRKGAARPKRAEPSFQDAYAQEVEMAIAEAPAEDYEYDPNSYEAAAAAGYAPPPLEPLFPEDRAPDLPNFFGEKAPVAPLATEPAAGKLFSDEALDTSLDALFSGLEIGSMPAMEPAPDLSVPEPEPVPEPLFAAPEPEPMPLAPPEPILEAPAPLPQRAPVGPRPPAERLVLSQGQDLRALLGTIDRAPGVGGSLLVGHDGLIIATTLPADVDRDYLGAQACSLFAGNSQQLGKMQHGELRRMLLETASGAMLMTAADMGILVVISKDGQTMDETAVLAAIGGALGRA